MTDELKEVDLWELVWKCGHPVEFDRLRREAKAEYDRLLKLCRGQQEDVMSLSRFGAHMLAWGIIRGTRWGYEIGEKRPDDTVVSKILKSVTVVNLLLKTPKVSTVEICNVLDDKKIPLPWPELRKEELWATCATKSKVKMAVSHARKAAKQMASDERWLHLINSGDAGDLFSDFRFKDRKKKSKAKQIVRVPMP